MNLNGDEKRIRQLFRELNGDDERLAPEFASVIEAAHSRTADSQPGTRSLALVWTVAVIFIAVLTAVSFAVRHPKPQPLTDPADQAADQAMVSPRPGESPPSEALPKPPLDPPGKTAPRTIPKRVLHRRTSDELAIRMKSLSSWQSPTASLLKAPGEEILKSLPRLGEAFQSIKVFSPEQFN